MIAAASTLPRESLLAHTARSFGDLPNVARARSLLADLATARCRFGPVFADRPLALYGAGKLGRLARDFMNTVGYDFTIVIDRNARQLADNPGWRDARLLSPADVPLSAKSRVCLAVGVATSPYVPLERSLFDLAFEHVVPFYDLAESFRHLHPLSNGWFAAPLTEQDQEHAAEVLEGWADDVSRAHHLQFLAWRRLREEWSFERAPLTDCSAFFIPEVVKVLHRKESLVDAGAYHGGVTDAFLRQTEGKFRQIIAIEPDPWSRARLKEALRAWLTDGRVSILSCALGATEGEAPFHDGLGYASQLSDTGRMRVMVRPLDALGLAPTFVKLHLEGGELAALRGARQTLLSSRPLVAVTVYHNADGIWRTPLWLMETLPDYRFLFRAHSWCGTGAIVYAIPNERMGRG
jgi:FkbM family methyltransferase